MFVNGKKIGKTGQKCVWQHHLMEGKDLKNMPLAGGKSGWQSPPTFLVHPFHEFLYIFISWLGPRETELYSAWSLMEHIIILTL